MRTTPGDGENEEAGASTEVLAAFTAEAERLEQVTRALEESSYSLPTPCPPWDVAGLLTHVLTAVMRTPVMLAAPEPVSVDSDAVGYYRPEIFSAGTDAARVETARHDAASYPSGRAIAERFAVEWRRTRDSVSAEPAGRRVTTRHGDHMLLTEFMVTRVAELVLHGLDLASALGREPWTTAPAADVVERLLLTAEGSAGRPKLGWDQPTFLAKATGRAPLTPVETARVRELGITWIRLG